MKKTLLFAFALIAVGPVTVEAQVVERVKCGLLDLIGVECAGPNPRRIDELVTTGSLWMDNQVYLDPETLEPYSGPVFELWPEDPTKLLRRSNLKDGVEDGLFEMWYKNGQLWMRSMSKDGKEEGLFESYYEDGAVMNKGMRKDGEACGEWIEEEKPVTYPPC